MTDTENRVETKERLEDAIENLQDILMNYISIDAEYELNRKMGNDSKKWERRQRWLNSEEGKKEIKEKVEDFCSIMDKHRAVNRTSFYTSGCIYNYLTSKKQGIYMSNIEAAQFINDEYDDDFFLRKLQVEKEMNKYF